MAVRAQMGRVPFEHFLRVPFEHFLWRGGRKWDASGSKWDVPRLGMFYGGAGQNGMCPVWAFSAAKRLQMRCILFEHVLRQGGPKGDVCRLNILYSSAGPNVTCPV